jgi:hypothetical protein
LWIRIWGGDLGPLQCFSFDFVNRRGNYILIPENVKIYSDGYGEVLSVEACFRQHAGNESGFMRKVQAGQAIPPQGVDKNWETYVVPEGTRLRIMQRGMADRFITIPTRESDLPVEFRPL